MWTTDADDFLCFGNCFDTLLSLFLTPCEFFMKYSLSIGACFLFSFFFFIPSVFASTIISAPTTISSPTTWTLANSPYVVRGFGTVTVNSVLTIEPGVVVKFEPRRSVGRTNGLAVTDGGQMVAIGTNESPIFFTAGTDDTVGGDTNNDGSLTSPRGGDWDSLLFENDASVLSHVIIRHGGNQGRTFGSVEIENNSQVNISDATISESAKSGVWIAEPAVPTLTRLTIANNDDYGIAATVATPGATLLDSLVRNNHRGAMQVSVENGLEVLNTTFTDNQPQTIDLTGSTITRDTRWPYIPNLVYTRWHSERMVVNVGITLAIDPGVQVKMLRRSSLYVEGALQANGTEEAPILFTSYTDDTVGGDTNFDGALSAPAPGDLNGWGGIYFAEASPSSLSHIIFRYGGYSLDTVAAPNFSDNKVIHIESTDVDMDHVAIEHSHDTGVYVDGTSIITFDDSEIHHTPRGMEVYSDSAFAMRNNSFVSTSIFALNMHGAGQIDATRNWWGDESGPLPAGRGEIVAGNVLYDPWIGKRDPVILIPGILGTEMWRGEELLWPNALAMLFSPSDDFMDPLGMSEGGGSQYTDVLYGDVIREVDYIAGSFIYLDSLISNFENSGYNENIDLFVFPYDWRLDIQTNSGRLNDKIVEILAQTGADKVDIMAHSMGGVLTKQYVVDYGGNDADTIIFVGTPHMGSPDAAKTLLFGSDAGMAFGPISLLNQAEIKKIARNMTSVYQLLPSERYFSDVGRYFDDLTQPLVPDYSATMDFLATQDLNESHLSRADAFSSALDNFAIPEDVNAFSISGCKEPTLGQIIRRNSGVEDEYALGFIAGDGTVPLGSSDALDLPTSHRFYLNSTNHGGMPSEEDARQLIVDLIRRPDLVPTTSDNVTHSRTGCTIHGRVISVHSPVDLHVYDAVGNHVGPTPDGNLDLGIPGVAYENIANNKFVFLPDGVDYEVELDATDTGTFNMRVADVADSQVVQTVYYNSVQIIPESVGQLTLSDLELDYEGSGEFSVVPVTAVLDATSSLDMTKPVTQIQTDPSAWTREPVTVTLSASDDNSGILRTEYSLDNGITWYEYSSPFEIISEGIRVSLRSVDRVGNVEEVKLEDILIDVTPPEVALTLDPITKQIVMTGVDVSGTTVTTTSPNVFAITDEAGNTTELQTTLTTTTNGAGYSTLSWQITQMRRNGGDWQVPERNQIFAQWQIDDDGVLVWLQEALQVKNEFYIIGKYETATNETTIWRKGSSGLQEEGKVSGIVLPTLQTDDLSFIYY